MFDYSWRCECDVEKSSTLTLNQARKEAREHLKTHYDKTPNWSVWIDQHERGGDMTDKDWKIVKNK